MNRPKRRIAVVTGDHTKPDPTKPGGRYNPEDLEMHDVMVRAMSSLSDFEFSFWTDHDKFLAFLDATPPDLVVNFCDTGLYNQAGRELNFPAYLEIRDIPYTGAPPSAMVLCYDKAVVRMVAAAEGLPVPREDYVPADAPFDELQYPLPGLIKPNAADGSLGITKDAVVRTPEDARRYMTWLRETLPGRDALVQEYLPGPEYGIGLIGNPETGLEGLPMLEVDFSGLPKGLNPILSYESKSLPDSPYWTEIKFKRAVLDAGLEERLIGWCRRLFRRLGLRDYGRFDFRVADDGEPKLMEVNPNPAWDAGAKLAIMAGLAGIDYPGLLKMIIDAAVTRLDRK